MNILSLQKLSSFFMILILVFPLLPVYFGASQVHINLLVIFVASIVIFLSLVFGKGLGRADPVVFMYYSLAQVLLIPSYWHDIQSGVEGFSGVVSFLRPTLLYVMYLTFNSTARGVLNGDSKLLIYFLVLSLLYSVVELFGLWDWAVYFFYKREEKIAIARAVVTFFGTTYYAGYVYLVFFLLSYSTYLVKKKPTYLLLSAGALILTIAAQSKIIWLSLILSLFMLAYFNAKGSSGKVKFLVFVIAAFSFLFFGFEYLYKVLLSLELKSVRSLNTLLFNTENSGTLLVRLEQILFSVNSLIDNNTIFGLGLARELELESWVSLFLYRYGLLGFLSFIAFVFYLVFTSITNMKRLRGSRYYFYSVICLIWSLLLPLTQLSTAMIELSKLAVISSFMIALTVNLKSLRESA